MSVAYAAKFHLNIGSLGPGEHLVFVLQRSPMGVCHAKIRYMRPHGIGSKVKGSLQGMKMQEGVRDCVSAPVIVCVCVCLHTEEM